ncbi:MAG TPA: copper chaperone PCu(A)C [Burkholderiales bacterium]|nr:copper chaperone PCu(A)C [Burkholderiales bacterium]
MRLLAAALFLFTLQAVAKDGIEVHAAWSRATPPGAKVAVGYMEIRNTGSRPDRLVGASTPVAKHVEMHITRREGEVMRMRQVKDFEIPPRGSITLAPGGSHLMLVETIRPLEKGERFPMRLRFERAGELDIELEVQERGSRHPRHRSSAPGTRHL